MFSLYKCHLIKNSLSVILLSLILFNITLNQQGVNGDDESNLPYSQGPDKLNILNTILQTNLVNRKEKIIPRDLTINVKESDIMNQAFYNNIETNDSNVNWDHTVTDVEQKQDIICCYRKTSNDTTKFEDWKKLLNIAEGFTTYSDKNNRSKYLICLKKINIDEITTVPSILETTLASSRKEIEFNGTKNGRKNKKKKININTNINLHNSDKNCDEYDDAKINQADDLSCVENKSTTIVLENVTSKYTKNKVNNIPNYFQENFLAKNVNKNKYFINNEYRHNKRYPINYRQIYDRNLKMRKAMKKTKLLILISDYIL
ncbi:PREDICTED: uncharacterized protein LOC105363523 [Ceratosolen solmsi marchali]|uniref:Uncharacterized protein LOC105363523 n=1 Tax=Ceratosolen solmsi marchali TaxID=326594 RepID=A0AAJ6YK55_9HYME|nr:PREDICTED: uncharacterized protein LOC105363523 [Ceratosolen solmsi marchali]